MINEPVKQKNGDYTYRGMTIRESVYESSKKWHLVAYHEKTGVPWDELNCYQSNELDAIFELIDDNFERFGGCDEEEN